MRIDASDSQTDGSSSETTRELRDDANSDPMRRQTDSESIGETGSAATPDGAQQETPDDAGQAADGSNPMADGSSGANATESQSDAGGNFQGAETDTATEYSGGADGSASQDSPDGTAGNTQTRNPSETQMAEASPTDDARRGARTDTATTPVDDAGEQPSRTSRDEQFDRADPQADGSTARADAVDGTTGAAADPQSVNEEIEQDTERASQSVSLGTTGMGTSGTRQSRLDEQTPRANQSASLGTDTLGTTGTEQSRTREETARASQSASLGTEGLGTSLPRQERKQAAEEQIREQLNEQGVDPDNVDVDVSIDEEGEVVADVSQSETEQFGDYEVRLPSLQDDESAAEAVVERAAGAVGSPIGAATSTVLGGAADAAGIGGDRFENVAGQAGDRIRSTISATSETGGEVVERGIVTAVSGGVPSQSAQDLADLGITGADAAVESVDVSENIDSYTEGVYEGAAGLANVPETAVTLKEGAEYAAYGATETAAGRGGEFVEQSEEAAQAAAARAIEQAEANPSSTFGRVSGGVAASTVGMSAAGAASSRAGALARGVVQPGEELVTTGARAATGAARSSSRLSSAVSRGADAGRSAASRVSDSDFVSDTRAQSQLVFDERETTSATDPDAASESVRITGDELQDVEATSELEDPAGLGRDFDPRGYVPDYDYPTQDLRTTEPEATTETATRTDVPRTEFQLLDEEQLEQQTGPQIGVEENLGMGTEVDTVTESRVDDRLGVETDTEQRLRTETDMRSPLDVRSDTRTEARSRTEVDQRIESRTRTDTRQDQRTEARQEFRLAIDRRNRREGVEQDADDGEGRRRRRRDLDGWVEREERDLINPITGE